MRTARIPLALANLKIEEFISGAIITAASWLKNLVLSQYPDDRFFVTQRPSVNVVLDASADGVTTLRGRGCYYWTSLAATYFVNGGEVYKDNHSTTVREVTLNVGANNLDGSVGNTTATLTYTAHGMLEGDTVIVEGATQTEYNGTFVVTGVPTVDTFTYTTLSNITIATATTTGTITFRRAIASAVTKVYFFEVGTYLVILDPASGRGWTISAAASTTLVKITDTDFPSNFVRGGAVLNGRLYVLGADGVVASSGEGDPTSWNALDTIQANYAPDVGVLCGLHNQHVVAFGANTIEYFYDNANPTGSPLAKRLDVVHEIGAVSEDTFWTDNNVNFFVGISRSGGLTVYIMVGFELQAISNPEIDSFLTTAYMKEGKHFHASGAVVGGRVFYILTIYSLATPTSNASAVTSLVFHTVGKTRAWAVWELMHAGVDHCPLVDWTLSTSSTIAKGILTNGDLVAFQDDLSPQDLLMDFGVFESGVFEMDVFVASGGEGTPIEFEIITGANDFKSMNWKRMDSFRVSGNRTANTQTLTVSVSDEVNDDWVEVGTLDMSHPGERINRLGAFRQRNFRLSGAFDERMELETAEVELEVLRS